MTSSNPQTPDNSSSQIVRIMAEYLASIFGTEKDKVNCTFYFKIGACRHGETCTRIHNKPTFSQTIVLLSMYKSPAATAAVLDPAGLGGLNTLLLLLKRSVLLLPFIIIIYSICASGFVSPVTVMTSYCYE